MKNNKSQIIIALNFNDINKILNFVDQIDPNIYYLKIGKDLFTLFGPSIIKKLQKRNFSIFLDLKFFDIPSTTAYAVAAAANLGIWMMNVHAMGGTSMMEAAKKALLPLGKDAPLLIAVTILTSMNNNELKLLGINSSIKQSKRLAQVTYDCGLDGVVCSAHEVSYFRKIIKQKFLIVTPGIRPIGVDNYDQHRTVTPEQAKKIGVDYMVIGRPILQSSNPMDMLQSITDSLKNN
ncbi:MAG: orotidine-5'-phosphate decarboxylase [Pantoea sp. Brub]|nr:orotidine-5'-phosphate decarboxylase [Pantoea sp. Brub]